LRLDIKHYFETIPHNFLLILLAKVFDDLEILDLLQLIIKHAMQLNSTQSFYSGVGTVSVVHNVFIFGA
jgi:retron-type reverse transcriptase